MTTSDNLTTGPTVAAHDELDIVELMGNLQLDTALNDDSTAGATSGHSLTSVGSMEVDVDEQGLSTSHEPAQNPWDSDLQLRAALYKAYLDKFNEIAKNHSLRVNLNQDDPNRPFAIGSWSPSDKY